MRIFIFGFGNVAKHFVTNLATRKEFHFAASSRNVDLKSHDNVKFIDFSDNGELKKELEKADHILISTPTNDEGDPSIAKILAINPNFQQLKSIIYLSSTGVYGDHQGRWVNENSELKATDKRASARIKAEILIKDFAETQKISHLIFRLAGIYDDQNNILTRLKQGKALNVDKKGQFFSRIHVKDIARAIYQSIENNLEQGTYNLADDEPIMQDRLLQICCEALKIPLPPSEKFDELDDRVKIFYSSNKKVSNEKFKNKLNFKFEYPSILSLLPFKVKK